jgi:hypothetical protein
MLLALWSAYEWEILGEDQGGNYVLIRRRRK